MARIILMNPNTNAATTQEMVTLARPFLPDVEGWTAPSGAGLLLSEALLEQAASLVAKAEIAPCDGVIVSAFGDPGRAALAERLPCPVLGIGQEAARAAARLCAPKGTGFAVVTTTPTLRGPIDALMQENAGAAPYLGCFFTEGEPLALMQDPARLDAALLEVAERATRAGAACAIIGGGPLGAAAERLEARAPLPLISPVKAAAEAMRIRLGA